MGSSVALLVSAGYRELLHCHRMSSATLDIALFHGNEGAVIQRRRSRHSCRRQETKGLQFVEITTDTDNVASQRVVISAGGVLIERFKSLTYTAARKVFAFEYSCSGQLPTLTSE